MGVKVRFQFPSNGKAYLNFIVDLRERNRMLCVSIPFKRESVSEQVQRGLGGQSCWELVSIPFKRESVSEHTPNGDFARGQRRFQFPSNGKAYLNYADTLKLSLEHFQFQFPSNGKAYLNCYGYWPTN